MLTVRTVRTLTLVVCFLALIWGATATADSHSININEASQEELQQLTYIGEVRAERIVEYRQEQDFGSKEEIMEVEGIGEAVFEEIEERIALE